ncbi:hypothetical protein [Lichenicoccus sp.]|uniref:hypothetical protein n=1 Tax=Lichenicoccus sp. TaxID=2781899 RepID=UPI003D1094C9
MVRTFSKRPLTTNDLNCLAAAIAVARQATSLWAEVMMLIFGHSLSPEYLAFTAGQTTW